MLLQKLTQLGFIENTDFSLSGEVLLPLPQIRMVEQIIEHDEVPATYDGEGMEITPATPAWQESIQVEETFYAALPTIEEVKRLCVIDNDPALLIGEYLKGKAVTDDDSLNVDLFLNGQNGWRFSQVSAPSFSELFSLIEPVKQALEIAKVKQDKIESGRRDRQKCETALDYIAGYNREQSFTIEQITQMQQTFSQAESLLRANRPDFASQVISAIVVDGVIVTEELKQNVLEILQNV
jgi:hypothetical protein